MTLELALIFLLAGAFVGVISGLLGIGGGLILVPFFVMMFGKLQFLPEHLFHYALGTSMACIVVTSLFSMRSHHRKQAVVWPYVRFMSVGVIVGAFFTTFLVANMQGSVLSLIFSVFLMFVAWQMLRTSQGYVTHSVEIPWWELTGVAYAIGAISSLVSIGGGSLTVPYLAYRHVDIKKAIGTSAALGFFISIAGTAGYLLNGPITIWQSNWPIAVGYVYLPAVLLIGSMSIFTVSIGANLAHQLPVKTIKRIFALLLVFISIKLWW